MLDHQEKCSFAKDWAQRKIFAKSLYIFQQWKNFPSYANGLVASSPVIDGSEIMANAKTTELTLFIGAFVKEYFLPVQIPK